MLSGEPQIRPLHRDLTCRSAPPLPLRGFVRVQRGGRRHVRRRKGCRSSRCSQYDRFEELPCQAQYRDRGDKKHLMRAGERRRKRSPAIPTRIRSYTRFGSRAVLKRLPASSRHRYLHWIRGRRAHARRINGRRSSGHRRAVHPTGPANPSGADHKERSRRHRRPSPLVVRAFSAPWDDSCS